MLVSGFQNIPSENLMLFGQGLWEKDLYTAEDLALRIFCLEDLGLSPVKRNTQVFHRRLISIAGVSVNKKHACAD